MNRGNNRKALDLQMKRLEGLIVELDEEASLVELRSMLDAGVDPKKLLACCMEAMVHVGMRFEKGVYFIAALIMAGEIMRSATEMLSPYLASHQNLAIGGRVLLGTVHGDIHELGKNLFGLLLKCHDFEVFDLGVDIPEEQFLRQAVVLKPDIIGLSCVLTNGIESLKQTVTFLNRKLPDPKPPIIVGGTCVDELVAKYSGVKFWAAEATTGLRICQEIVTKKQ